MTRRSLRAPIAALVLAMTTSACSHAGDASATPSPTVTVAMATTTPTAAAVAATATADGASVDGQRESVTKNGVTSSMGVATEAELAEIGLPIYPTITLQNTFIVKHVDKQSAAYRLQVSVKDDIGTVAGWYAKKLGKSFTSGHVAVMGGISSFSRKTPSSNETVLLQSQQDENLHIPLTTITMTVTKRR